MLECSNILETMIKSNRIDITSLANVIVSLDAGLTTLGNRLNEYDHIPKGTYNQTLLKFSDIKDRGLDELTIANIKELQEVCLTTNDLYTQVNRLMY